MMHLIGGTKSKQSPDSTTYGTKQEGGGNEEFHQKII